MKCKSVKFIQHGLYLDEHVGTDALELALNNYDQSDNKFLYLIAELAFDDRKCSEDIAYTPLEYLVKSNQRGGKDIDKCDTCIRNKAINELFYGCIDSNTLINILDRIQRKFKDDDTLMPEIDDAMKNLRLYKTGIKLSKIASWLRRRLKNRKSSYRNLNKFVKRLEARYRELKNVG